MRLRRGGRGFPPYECVGVDAHIDPLGSSYSPQSSTFLRVYPARDDVGIVPYSFLPAFPLREKIVLLFSVACGTMRLGILYAKKYALHPGRPERQQEV